MNIAIQSRPKNFNRPLRVTISVISLLVVCGCTAPTVEGGTKPAPAATLPIMVKLDYGKLVTLQIGQTNEKLDMTLTAVKDSRCPKEARCIWAGHAAVTLKVNKADVPGELIIIGTAAPVNMNLPFEASYAGYQFKLVTLDPANSVSPTAANLYKATVQISTATSATK